MSHSVCLLSNLSKWLRHLFTFFNALSWFYVVVYFCFQINVHHFKTAVKPNPGNNTYEVPDIVQLEPKNGTTSPPSNSPQVTTLNESEDPPISPSDKTYTNLPSSILVSDLEEYYRRNKQNLVQEFQVRHYC